jgi:hypothetical protein
MNDQSPPKRVTRARAAAKTTDAGVKTTKIATAASKAKATRSASIPKRKTRADDVQDDRPDELIEETIEPELPRATRGRAKKAAVVQPQPEMQEEPPAPAKPTRGRPRKAAAEPPAPETRSLRGRPKKVDVPEETVVVVEEPVKKTTRGRAATTSKAPAPKKSVKFEESDKENVVPPANVNAKPKEVATGLRAKPVRKPAANATTARATRGRAKVEEQKSSPLSPKKATQVATAKDNNSDDDELATVEKTPMKLLTKSPVKPPGSIFTSTSAKRLDFSTSTTVNSAVTQDLNGSIIASPARRPPPSPFKNMLKTSPQRANLGDSMLRPPFKLPLPPPQPTESGAPLKASLLQSPARRPQSPMKVAENGSPTRPGNDNMPSATPREATFKISRFGTPRTLTKSAIRPGRMLPPSALTNASAGSPAKAEESSGSDMLSAPSLKFTGRLSSILPRDSDPALSPSEPVVEEIEKQPESTQDDDPMVTEDTIAVAGGPMENESTTPIASPPRNSTGAFDLREPDENPFYDSDSKDELALGSPKFSPTSLGEFKVSSPNFTSSPATPTPFTTIDKTPRTAKSAAQRSERKAQIGFTPLAKQLSEWMSASPGQSAKSGSEAFPTTSETNNAIPADMGAAVQPSPVKSSYFEDEMSVRNEMQIAGEDQEQIIDENDFAPVELDEEDLALAFEADEMSLLDPDQLDNVEDAVDQLASYEPENIQNVDDIVDEFFNSEPEHNQNAENMVDEFINAEPDTANVQEMADQFTHTETENDDELIDRFEVDQSENDRGPDNTTVDEPAPSETSQEYGDENVMPIDPVLLGLPSQAPSTPKFVTPRRVLTERVIHTVSKVPLKAEAEDSPMRPSSMKRSASISKLPVQRPTNTLSRSNTVISYSPLKNARSHSPRKDADIQGVYATPSKADADVWSAIGTPARTPRRDLNPALLKGAVVFVDVHTTEGADASGLFVELLVQMGARCVKRWDWNGSKEDGSRIGITHVVFKDGGRRTLEKVKETGGVVTCVGVGWVLE